MESVTFSCLQLLFLCLPTQDQDEGISMISVERGHTTRTHYAAGSFHSLLLIVHKRRAWKEEHHHFYWLFQKLGLGLKQNHARRPIKLLHQATFKANCLVGGEGKRSRTIHGRGGTVRPCTIESNLCRSNFFNPFPLMTGRYSRCMIVIH